MPAHLANLELSVSWASFSRPVMKIEIMLPGHYLQHNVVYIEF
jgi:hypothetical protein